MATGDAGAERPLIAATWLCSAASLVAIRETLGVVASSACRLADVKAATVIAALALALAPPSLSVAVTWTVLLPVVAKAWLAVVAPLPSERAMTWAGEPSPQSML